MTLLENLENQLRRLNSLNRKYHLQIEHHDDGSFLFPAQFFTARTLDEALTYATGYVAGYEEAAHATTANLADD